MLLATAALLLAATACDPIVHSNLVTRANPGDGANLKLMSGDGRYVVLSATAAGPVVPGAGNWRVNRETGAADALPAGTPKSISRDGSRVLIGSVNLWVDGTTSTATGVLSPDLSAQAFVGSDGTVQTQDVVTGVTRPVETAFPRPAGSTPTVLGVSDDGDTVMYRFDSTLRVVDIEAGTFYDRAYDIAGRSVEYRLSGSGTTLAITDHISWFNAGLTLIHVPSGDTIGSYTDTSASWSYDSTYLAHDGGSAWLTHRQVVGDGEGPCPSAPMSLSCVVDTEAIHVSAGGVKVFDTYGLRVVHFSVTPNGRFALYTKEDSIYAGMGKPGPVTILDAWSTGIDSETLTSGPSTPAFGFMTDTGGLVATSSRTGGWLEFSDQ